MASMKLGSKPEAFHLESQSWHCTSGLPSDVTIEIGDMSFHLHKFPLLSRSGLLEKLIGDASTDENSTSVLQLYEVPGGAKSFELVAKFCYGVKIELTPTNVISLRCAAEYLQMNESHEEGNLVSQTESFLNEVFGSWTDTIKALDSCKEVLPQAEDLHIVSRCINSLAMKACADPKEFGFPAPATSPVPETGLWNGISMAVKPQPTDDDWWYEDVSFLGLRLYGWLIRAVEAGGMEPEKISDALVFYAKKYIPMMNKQSSFKGTIIQVKPKSKISTPSEADQRAILEEIVELLPNQKGVTSTRFLLRLLRTTMVLQTSSSCQENLEKRIGSQLDQATLEDVLIPNMGYSVETLYDIDCFQRILDHFMSLEQDTGGVSSPCIVEEGQLMGESHSLTQITMVANLVDAYLSDVAPDANLKFPKFQALAAAIPDFARPLSDGIYRAIDIYLKEHPWLTDSEKEQICRLMNCQKLSLEASTHAAQNERLPLRVIVQVLFFEQLRLRTSISSWFFVSDNLEGSQNQNPEAIALSKSNAADAAHGGGPGIEDIRDRVTELEKECRSMKEEIRKMVKTRRSWSVFCRRRTNQCDSAESIPGDSKTPPPLASQRRNHENDETGDR